MKEIKIRNLGKVALIDDEDYELVMSHNVIWAGSKHRRGLVCRSKLTKKTETLGRVIMGLLSGDSRQCDHINGDYLDNRRINLRIVTPSQNMANRGVTQRGIYSTKYKGITYEPSRNKWKAHLSFNGKTYNLGRFNTQEEAAAAYNDGAKKYFGEFARLNVL